MEQCDHHSISRMHQKYADSNICDIFKENCTDSQDGYIFSYLYYCGFFYQSYIIVIVFMIPFILQVFYLLSQTAEDYLSPTVTYISKKINMSQTLAGVTLLAIGNGCCDVITAVVAGQSEGGIGFTIGSIFGAGLFVTTVSLARVITKSKTIPIQPNKPIMIRDLSFFLIAISFILVYGFIGHITRLMAFLFFSLYFAYIVVTLIQEKVIKESQQKLEQEMEFSLEMNEQSVRPVEKTQIFYDSSPPKKKKTSKNYSSNNQNHINDILLSNSFEDEGDVQINSYNDQELYDGDEEEQKEQEEQNNNKNKQDLKEINLETTLTDMVKVNHYDDRISTSSSNNSNQISNLFGNNKEINLNSEYDTIDTEQKSVTYKLKQFFSRRQSSILDPNKGQKKFIKFEKLKRFLKSHAKDQESFKSKSFLQKIMYIWLYIVDFILKLTIPPSAEDWNKTLAILTSIIGPLFLFGSQSIIPDEILDPWNEHWIVLPIVLTLGIMLALFVWKTAHSNAPPSYMYIFTILTFANSLAWIGLLVQLLIDFLNFIQFLTNINKVFLGMTFLALGNSSGDYFTNGQLSKMGYAQMAFTGCYAGQLFNLLVGFGISLIINSWSHDLKFDLFGIHKVFEQNIVESLMSQIIVIVAFLNILVMGIYSLISKFTYGKPIVLWLHALYILVFAFAVFGGIYDFFTDL